MTLLSPREGLNDEVAYRVDQKQVEYLDKRFEPSDLDDPSITMVLTAIDEPDVSTTIWKLCKEKRIAANIADVPPECDFYFGSVHRDGPLQIMVSTNGNGPKMANLVRKRIEATLPPNIGDAIAKVGALRKRLRQIAPGNEEGPKRMKWWVLSSAKHSARIDADVSAGCRKCAYSGVSRTSVRWSQRIWMLCWSHMSQTRFLLSRKYGQERKSRSGSLMHHSAGLVWYDVCKVIEIRRWRLDRCTIYVTGKGHQDEQACM